jgi:hypothetical protein
LEELQASFPLAADLRGWGGAMRAICATIDSGNESGLRELIDGSVMRLMPTSLEHWSNHDDHKVMLRAVHDSLKSQLATAASG